MVHKTRLGENLMPEVTIEKHVLVELRRQGGLVDYLASNNIYILHENAKEAKTTTDQYGNITFIQEAK